MISNVKHVKMDFGLLTKDLIKVRYALMKCVVITNILMKEECAFPTTAKMRNQTHT